MALDEVLDDRRVEAAAELTVARGDDSAHAVVQAALDAAERGGAVLYQSRLLALAAITAEPDAMGADSGRVPPT